MKPVQIQFAAPRAWKFIWSITSVLLIGLSTYTGSRLWEQRQLRRELEAEIAQLQIQLKARANSKSPEVDPRHASVQTAERLLLRDWNRVFDAVESDALAQARLVQMSVDAETGDMRLAYELESFVQASAVTTALNASGALTVWRLERVSSMPLQTDFPAGKLRGVWSSKGP